MENRGGGRAVDCTGLENRQALTGLGGSNPSLPAIEPQIFYNPQVLTFQDRLSNREFDAVLYHSQKNSFIY